MLRKARKSIGVCANVRVAITAALLASSVPALKAQNSPSTQAAPSRASLLPLSGTELEVGTVTATQRTSNSVSGSVNVITSTVTVQSPYNGSAASDAVGGSILLTLKEALTRGLRANLGALSQSAAEQQARGQRAIAKSELFPHLNTTISEEFERVNLRTQGVEVNSFPESVQFNFFDARVRLNQSVFDLVQVRNLHSANENLQSRISEAKDARDLIALAVGGSYLQLIATQARVDAKSAQVETSQAIYKEAMDRLEAGLDTRVDVTRSRVQLQTEQQRLRSLRADVLTQKLKLARIIGLSAGQQFQIADEYRFSGVTNYTLTSALQKAFQDRSDLRAATSSVRAAETSVKAARAEHLPSLALNADFGAAGITPTHESTAVYSATGTLVIPLYEGGRIRGDMEQASAALRQRKAEFEDLRGQVDADVRQAFIDLDSAADQVDVARSNVELAHQTLTQSSDRFAAGIADTVEVVQSEQAVVQADDDYITAVYEHNLAKVSLARAMGNAEQTLPQLLTK